MRICQNEHKTYSIVLMYISCCGATYNDKAVYSKLWRAACCWWPGLHTDVLSGEDFAFIEAINTVNFRNLYSQHGLTALCILKCDL